MTSQIHNAKRSEIVPKPLPVSSAYEAACLISNAFPLDSKHSWSRALGIDSNMAPYLNGYLEKQLTLTDSIGITDDSGNLVGALIIELHPWRDKCQEGLEGINQIAINDIQWSREKEQFSEKNEYSPYDAIETILEECEVVLYKSIDANSDLNIFRRGDYGYIAWIAVSAMKRNQGLAGLLIQQANQMLEVKGCSLAVAYCVTPEAKLLFQKQGYEKIGEVNYKSFKYKDRFPFESIPDEISIMVKKITKKS